MTNYREFHDGWFDGLLVEKKTAHVFVSTHEKQRHVFTARGVLALLANEIREGNIILDLSTRPAIEVTLEELVSRAHTHPPYSAGGIDAKLLERAREQNLTILTINPSYGGTCLVLAESFESLTHDEWLQTVQKAPNVETDS
jgi:hypothetical protein